MARGLFFCQTFRIRPSRHRRREGTGAGAAGFYEPERGRG
jgi:hypothetical protein